MKYFIIDNATQTIVNAILVDPDNLPDVGDGYSLSETGGNIGDVLVDGEWVAPQPDPAEALAAERDKMVCSRLQGRLVLGEDTCNALDAMAADEATPWAMRQTTQNPIEWSRTSQAMTELGYLLGYSDTEMDDLFRIAMTVDV